MSTNPALEYMKTIADSITPEQEEESEPFVKKLVENADTNDEETLCKPLWAMFGIWDAVVWSAGLRYELSKLIDEPPISLETRKKVLQVMAHIARVKIEFKD